MCVCVCVCISRLFSCHPRGRRRRDIPSVPAKPTSSLLTVIVRLNESNRFVLQLHRSVFFVSPLPFAYSFWSIKNSLVSNKQKKKILHLQSAKIRARLTNFFLQFDCDLLLIWQNRRVKEMRLRGNRLRPSTFLFCFTREGGGKIKKLCVYISY